jgi:broad specificity phosphatase PhoE
MCKPKFFSNSIQITGPANSELSKAIDESLTGLIERNRREWETKLYRDIFAVPLKDYRPPPPPTRWEQFLDRWERFRERLGDWIAGRKTDYDY